MAEMARVIQKIILVQARNLPGAINAVGQTTIGDPSDQMDRLFCLHDIANTKKAPVVGEDDRRPYQNLRMV